MPIINFKVDDHAFIKAICDGVHLRINKAQFT